MTNHSRFDYIIIGAGSAGCVLANRLTEDPDIRVLLLETGGSDRSLYIQMPSALSIPMNMKKYTWRYKTEPEPFLNNREMLQPRGKVLGGSSSINGMVFVRGHPCDFDRWAELGAEGWEYQNCLPYFRKAEHWMYGESLYRGGSGPMAVNNGNGMQNPLYQAFIEAGRQAGYPVTEDYNGQHQEGVGASHMTVDRGVRCSTARAYLKPAMQRRNLTIVTKARVEKILLENKTASGVRFECRGQLCDLWCDREVILSAGAIGSPQLLQLSGIGDREDLIQAGVGVQHELPGVGRNLHDHLEFWLQVRCKQSVTLNRKLGSISKLLIGMQWLLQKKGLGATNHFEAGGFIRSQPDIGWPDIQYHFLPGAIGYDGKSAYKGDGFQLHVGHNKPKSRGCIRIRDGNPRSKPMIQFNYLEHEDDRQAYRNALRLSREIIQQAAFEPFRDGEIMPGEHVRSDDEIDAFIRKYAESAYHPCSSCKMGVDDMAVVDPQARVYGIDRLRVVDASIFPEVTNGNINAPTIMVAERVADMIRNN